MEKPILVLDMQKKVIIYKKNDGVVKRDIFESENTKFERISRRDCAYSKRVPRTNCALRIKKCAPRISSGIYFLSTS